ncbi:MAG: hypothetical protein V7727_14125 [Sneathiella sp.]
MDILHCGYDKLSLTVDVDIPEDFREALMEAKKIAARQNTPEVLTCNGMDIQVRKSGGGSSFSVSTGEYGAEWFFLDPHNKPSNNPGIRIDFRAFLLATGGLEDAKAHFEDCMASFGIRYADHLIKISRVDIAVDILAPSFVPDRKLVIAPPNTLSRERDAEPGSEHGVGVVVSGVTAGHISNRQLIIYDKRREIIQNNKPGWIEIWNTRRTLEGKPAIDVKDKINNLIWRFEIRMGSKQLRNRWEIRGWEGLEARIGDAVDEFTQKFRYAQPNGDTNRSRWPTHPIWTIMKNEMNDFFQGKRNFAEPSSVKTVNREAHKALLDTLILGNVISRAVADGIEPGEFESFVSEYASLICKISRKHPTPIDQRFSKSEEKYIFR